MKKFLSLGLAFVILCGCFITFHQPASAYPTNWGEYSIDYVNDLNNKYNIVTQEEIDSINQTDEASLDFVLKVLARLHYFAEHPYANIKNVPKDYIKYCVNNGIFDNALDNYNVPLTRGAFAHLLINAISNREMIEINVVNDGIIPDIEEDYSFKEAVYKSYRYGFFCGTDSLGTFRHEDPIIYNHVFVVINRVLNPNLRESMKLYTGDEITIQSKTYPMTYENKNKGLNIEITKERYYNTDAYIAHIKMTDPAHIKTIYSDLQWSNLGCEASTFNKRINATFMVNGDFRNAEFGEKLGIVRNRMVVNDKKFNNVLGMDLNGNLKKVYALTANKVLENNIRDTWTFGPWLIENGKILSVNNEARAPRTFIGQINRTDNVLEYIIVVADGRSNTNAGLTMLECANILKEKNCHIGYNLDGGGSSIMMFDGKVLNDPCYGERADIDYIYIK